MRRDVLAKGEWDETWEQHAREEKLLVLPSSPLSHTILSCLLLYTANGICVHDDLMLVLVTLREKTQSLKSARKF